METLGDLFKAVRATVVELEGAYALAVISQRDPDRLIVARMGCPVVIGLGEQENFVASDVAALLPVTRRFMFLEEGDVAEVRRERVRIGRSRRQPGAARRSGVSELSPRRPRRDRTSISCSRKSTSSRAPWPIRCRNGSPTGGCSRPRSVRTPRAVFKRVEGVHIVACGTSYHAGIVAQYFIEQILPPALPRRDRQRIPLSQCRGAEEVAARDDLAVR